MVKHFNAEKLSHALWGVVIGAGLMLGTLTIPSTIRACVAEKDVDRLYRERMYMKANTNYNSRIEYNEMYNLGLKLNVIKDGEEILAKELVEKIKKAPIQRVKDYVNNVESEKIIPF